MTKKGVITAERIEQAIHEIRGYRVMLDSALARSYGVETRILVRAVKTIRPQRTKDAPLGVH